MPGLVKMRLRPAHTAVCCCALLAAAILASCGGSGPSATEAPRPTPVIAAEFLGEADEFGAVREGLRADLLLLQQNPLEDVRAAEDPVGIMVNGDWYFGEALETLLRQAASR